LSRLVQQRAQSDGITFVELRQAELVCTIRSIIDATTVADSPDAAPFFFPWLTQRRASPSRNLPVFVRWQDHAFRDRLARAFGAEDSEHLARRIRAAGDACEGRFGVPYTTEELLRMLRLI
jgi:hypothetical protein